MMRFFMMLFATFPLVIAIHAAATAVHGRNAATAPSMEEYQCSLTSACELAAKTWYYCAGLKTDIDKYLCLCEYSQPVWSDSTSTCFCCLEPLSPAHKGITDYVINSMGKYCNQSSSEEVSSFQSLVSDGAIGTAEFQSPISIWDSLWSSPLVMEARNGFIVDGIQAGDVPLINNGE